MKRMVCAVWVGEKKEGPGQTKEMKQIWVSSVQEALAPVVPPLTRPRNSLTALSVTTQTSGRSRLTSTSTFTVDIYYLDRRKSDLSTYRQRLGFASPASIFRTCVWGILLGKCQAVAFA